MKTVNLAPWLFCVFMLGCAVRLWLFPYPDSLAQYGVAVEQDWAFERWSGGKKTVYPLPLTTVEQRFANGFPGEIGRFSDGETVWVVRHIARPTRLLHPAADCYRGLGYQISAPRVVRQASNIRWQCFIAERGRKLKLQVCERIFDDKHSQWTDVSAWYWESLFQPGPRQWWAVTQVTPAA